ncbi:UDP-N-acetylmuramate dehydrogenase [Agreia sp. PsM10]|uniref:UDP-N-acetylmuramate dehydrogenase n=1 Tax=Agreia sp. PsM10 TaxID=3030533 RepID=UPI00263A58E5|nr:UDP-N-acetylmuramate dehydrogenase [Agreia sp. PsM10]MDN4641392.1 UDP-N-acetylmuramate dehydrogenase [Agreia sp. PsM10]
MTGRHGRPEPHPGEPVSGRIEGADVPLGPLTTLRVGGPAARIIEPQGEPQLLQAVLEVWDSGDDWLVLGGGSNVVISDDGFDGTVIRVATRGVARIVAPSGTVRLRVQAGEPWDELVAYTVEQGWSGLEALSGIPGSTGASPIQNIGAYGQEAGDSIVSVDFLDYGTGRVERIARDDLELGYRTSVFKRGRRGVVLSVTFSLTDASAQAGAAGESGSDAPGPLALGDPIAYPQLATALGVAVGDRVALGGVRAAVLRLRASKGMVLDATDPDSVSAGSFFTNPIVSENFARGLPSDAPRWLVEPEAEPTVVALPDPASGLTVDLSGPLEASGEPAEPQVKLSAAWLIERAGIGKGFALPGSRAAISSKHTLAIVNTGGATAAEISELSRYIQNRVSSEFGVRLHPEPVFVGLD